MGISLLTQLDELSEAGSEVGQFRCAFFLTYTLNLRFFEQLVLPRLNRLGVVHIGILADRHGYQSSLEDPLGQEQCGKSYVVGTPHHQGSLQYAKMLWLHGDRDLVYVGSHNLTMSGFNDQLEVTFRLDSEDLSHRAPLRQAHQAVTTLVRDSGYLQQIWGRISKPYDVDVEPSVHFLWSGESSILNQMVRIVGDASRIHVVTPFLDAGALAALQNQLGAEEVTLDLPHEGADTPLANVAKAVRGLVARRAASGIRLHAKTYWFDSGNKHWLAMGSANCTYAGLIKGAPEGGNLEFLLITQGGWLPDDALDPEVVQDTAELPGTGQRLDEEGGDDSLVEIIGAEFNSGDLTVTWRAREPFDSATLAFGERRHSLGESPYSVKPDRPPSSVAIEVNANGRVSETRAWVVFPADLEAYASRANALRWREYLESENPAEYANGIDAYLLQVLRDLFSAEAEWVTRPPLGQSLRSDAEMKEAVEIFEFSSDPGDVAGAATALVVGDSATDPLGALRGLIARLRSEGASSLESDEDSIERFEMHRQRAVRRVADRLVWHLRSLADPEVNWVQTPIQPIIICLRGTFEAAFLLWRDVLAEDSRSSIHSRLLESFLELLQVCLKWETTREASKENSVAGPLALAIGVAAEAASETEDYERLQQVAKDLVTDPKAVVDAWLEKHKDRGILLGARYHGPSDLEPWLRHALRLLGRTDPVLEGRQRQRWGLLLELYNADLTGNPQAPKLAEEADKHYGDHKTWQRYKSQRASGRSPKLVRVTKPTCGSCFISLPTSGRRDLERGDMVICGSCGTILLWGKHGQQ